MRPRTMLVTLVQGVGVLALAVMLGQAVETAPVARIATTTPTPCAIRRAIDSSIRTSDCEVSAVQATYTAGIADGSIYGAHLLIDQYGRPVGYETYGTVPPRATAFMTDVAIEREKWEQAGWQWSQP